MKKRFNIIDYSIITIVIVGLAAGYFLLNNRKNRTVETVQQGEIKLSFYIPDVENATLAPIKVGNRAIDTRKKTDLGVLEQLELKDAEAFAIGADGLSRVYSKPDYSSAHLTLASKGNLSSDGIYIGRYKYMIGDWVVLNLGQSTVYAVINKAQAKGAASSDPKQSANGSQTSTISIYAKSAMDFVADHIREHDPVVDLDTGIQIGTVSKITVVPEENYNPSADGRLVLDSRKGYVGLKLEVKTDGKLSDSGLLIKNYNYTVGRTFNLSVGITALPNVKATEFKSNGDATQ